MSTPQGLAVPQQRGSLEAGLEFAGTFLSGGVPGIVLTNSPAPPTNFSNARGIRGTSQKRQPPSLRPGFSRVARAPLYWSRPDADTPSGDDGAQDLRVRGRQRPASAHTNLAAATAEAPEKENMRAVLK
jgi:hypothetical protein